VIVPHINRNDAHASGVNFLDGQDGFAGNQVARLESEFDFFGTATTNRKERRERRERKERKDMRAVKALSDQVRQTAYEIHVYYGHGHLEKVYKNALMHWLRKAGFDVKEQHPVKVFDEDHLSAFSAFFAVK